MTPKTLLVLGANSDIAQAAATKYASEGYQLFLISRNIERLDMFATDLKIRYQCEVSCFELDILDTSAHRQVYTALPRSPDGVVCAIGYLGDQAAAQDNATELALVTQSNYTAIAQFLEIVAADMAGRKSGFIIGVSSVAGDRGRKSNYIYGAAKAAYSAYLSGLRNRLCDYGVQVLTVKPGFVQTSMTKKMDLPKALTAQPSQVASDIYKAQVKGRNVVYSKSVWLVIMSIIKVIPEFIFKKLNL